MRTEDPLSKIRQLQEERAGRYEDAADIVVDTDGKDPEAVASEIISILGI